SESRRRGGGPSSWGTATTYSFTRSDSPRRACSTEKRRKRQSRAEEIAGHDSAQLLADQLLTLWVDTHMAGESGTPETISNCSEPFKHCARRGRNGRPPRADDDRWSRFPSRPSSRAVAV